MICPQSCSITTEQPLSNNEAKSLLATLSICLSFPTVLPYTWREGHLIDPRSIFLPRSTANPEQNTANLNFIPFLNFGSKEQINAAIAAPCENPRIPSNGPSLVKTSRELPPAIIWWRYLLQFSMFLSWDGTIDIRQLMRR
ncbi:hypothetical protein LINGRAHAP2_LOCUS30937, partial [Linum grandiflorum]